MCGTQDASHIWQLEVDMVCTPEAGFAKGKHCAALFMNTMEDIRTSFHGDDFVVLADDFFLEHMDKILTGKCTAKNLGKLGSEGEFVSELQLLNRSIRCGRDDREEYIDTEPDIRSAKIIYQE